MGLARGVGPFGRPLRPNRQFVRSLFRGFERGVLDSYIVLRSLVSSPCGAAKPADRLTQVLWHSASGLITKAQITLRGGAFLVCGHPIPLDGFLKVLRHNLAGF